MMLSMIKKEALIYESYSFFRKYIHKVFSVETNILIEEKILKSQETHLIHNLKKRRHDSLNTEV